MRRFRCEQLLVRVTVLILEIGSKSSSMKFKGYPPGEQAWIANFGGSNRPSWRILRAKNEIQSDWTGDYNSAEGALAVIQDEFE
jgi:hypothetical protein